MGRRKNPEAEIATKERILTASLDMFSHNGFGGARMEEIVKKAGVSYGIVYYHYASKDVLFHSTVQYAIEEFMKNNLIISTESGPYYDLLEPLISGFLDWANTEKGAQCLLLLQTVLTAKDIPEITRIYVKDRFQSIYIRLKTIMEHVQDEGHCLDTDPSQLASILNALIIGGAFLRIARVSAPLDTYSFMTLFR